MFCKQDDRSRLATSSDHTHRQESARSMAVVRASAWAQRFPPAHARAPRLHSRLCGMPRGEFQSVSVNSQVLFYHESQAVAAALCIWPAPKALSHASLGHRPRNSIACRNEALKTPVSLLRQSSRWRGRHRQLARCVRSPDMYAPLLYVSPASRLQRMRAPAPVVAVAEPLPLVPKTTACYCRSYRGGSHADPRKRGDAREIVVALSRSAPVASRR